MPGLLDNHVRVTNYLPCPVCGAEKWCLIAKNGTAAICQRVESRTSWPGVGFYHDLEEIVAVPRTVKRAAKRPKLSTREVYEVVSEHIHHPDYEKALYDLNRLTGISVSDMRDFNVGWTGSAHAFPMSNLEQEFCGIRYRNPETGEKWSLRGGAEGFFKAGDNWYSDPVFVCEGATDALALTTLGCNAIGRPNCEPRANQVAGFLERIKSEFVVIVSDNDEPGRKGARSLDKVLLGGFERVVSIVPKKHKDVCEYLADGGIRSDIMEIVNTGTENEYWSLL